MGRLLLHCTGPSVRHSSGSKSESTKVSNPKRPRHVPAEDFLPSTPRNREKAWPWLARIFSFLRQAHDMTVYFFTLQIIYQWEFLKPFFCSASYRAKSAAMIGSSSNSKSSTFRNLSSCSVGAILLILLGVLTFMSYFFYVRASEEEDSSFNEGFLEDIDYLIFFPEGAAGRTEGCCFYLCEFLLLNSDIWGRIARLDTL